jgi:hypothetical protein
LDECQPLHLTPSKRIFLGSRLSALKPKLSDRYPVISIADDYSHETPVPNVNGILKGDLGGVILGAGKFIDGAALAILAQEAGCIVSDYAGQPLPRLDACQDYAWPGLVIASSPTIYQDLLAILDGFELPPL